MKLDKEETKKFGIKVMRKEEAAVEKTEAPKSKKEKKSRIFEESDKKSAEPENFGFRDED